MRLNYNSNTKLKRESDGHLYWLDLIRFLAAFAVMACHFRGAFFEEYTLLPVEQHTPVIFGFYSITRLGFEAVLIFFVLSGLLVGGRTMHRLASGTFNIKSYVIDRAVRIMLPLIASLLFFLPIALYFDLPISISSYIGSLFSLQGILTGMPFEPLWSLSYEVWFYILACGIAIIIMKRKENFNWKYKCGIILIILAFLVFSKLKVVYLFIWIFGAIAFWKLPKNNLLILIISGIVSCIIIALLQIGSGGHFTGINAMSDELFRNCLIVLFGFSFAIFLQHAIQMAPKSNMWVKINEIGTKLAAFSYTLYLTHVPVLRLLQGLGAPKSASINITSISLYLLWVAIALIVAYILYWLFERNTAAVKKYIKKKLHIQG